MAGRRSQSEHAQRSEFNPHLSFMPGDRRLVVGKRLGQPCLAQEGAAPGMKLAYEELLGFAVLRVEVAA